MIYFTADLHLLHKNIVKYNRSAVVPDINAMNQMVIDTINNKVSAQDTLYVLGDVMLGSVSRGITFLQQIKCRNIFLVPGNHDSSKFLKKLGTEVLPNWTLLPPLFETKIKDKSVVMCHFPLASWHKMGYGSFHLHGHSHGSYSAPGKLLDVGIDQYLNMYGELGIFSWEEIVVHMESRALNTVDHHGENRDD